MNKDNLHCVKSVKIRGFLVRIFPYSDRIRKDTEYLSVLSTNAGQYGPEKTPYLDTFRAVLVNQINEISYFRSGGKAFSNEHV